MTFDRPRALDLLTTLYGSEAPSTLGQLEVVLDRHRPLLAARAATPLDQNDVFLIAYPDQLQAPGSAPLDTLGDFIRRRLGGIISGIHVLPFFPSSSDDGFSVVDYRSVDPDLGGWDQLHRLGHDHRLMVDLVLNHASAQGGWFEAYRRREAPFREFFLEPAEHGDWSRVVRPRTSALFTDVDTATGRRRVWTTFGPDQVDLNFRRPAVLLEMVDLLLTYAEHGAQVLRLDAVAYLWKESGSTCVHLPQTHAVVKVLRLAARAAAPWLRLITETNVPHHEGISYFGNGDEADWVYAFPLPPLIVHALTSADAGPLTAWVASLEAPPAESALFNILATHDGLGLNGASGLLGAAEIDRLVRLGERCGAVSFRTESTGADRPYELNANLLDLLGEVHPESALPERAISRLVSAHAMQLALAGIPALYFHSLFGSRGDAAAVLRTGVPRAVNRERLDRSRLEAELHREGSRRRMIFEALSRLIRARQGLPALHPQAPQHALDLGPHIFGLERTSIDGRQLVICLHEVAGVADRIRLRSGVGHDVLAGEDIPLSGIPLAPYQTRWMRVVP